MAAQLSFVTAPRVLVRYHPCHQPPTAGGPFAYGMFVASLAGQPRIAGEGATEEEAIHQLAARLCDLAVHDHRLGRLTALGQALSAADRLTHDDLVVYLTQRAGEPRLAEY